MCILVYRVGLRSFLEVTPGAMSLTLQGGLLHYFSPAWVPRS